MNGDQSGQATPSAEAYFFDSYALVELSKASKGYAKFADCVIVTSLMNVYEFFYSALKGCGPAAAKRQVEDLNCNYAEIGFEDIMEASKFRFRHPGKKFSYIDCLGYALAKRQGLKFLTGDREFEGLENVEFVK